VVQADLAVLAAFVGLIFRRLRFAGLITSSVALGLLVVPVALAPWFFPPVPALYIGWLIFVRTGSAASVVIAGLTTIIAVRMRGYYGKAPASSPSLLAIASDSKASPQSLSAPAAPSAADACRCAKPASRWLWVPLSVAVLYLFWVFVGPITWTTTRIESCPNGVELRSLDLHELTPSFPSLVYHNVVAGRERTLLIRGREVLKSGDYKHLFPSPEGTFVVAEGRGYSKPIRIYTVADARFVELPEDDFPDHYNVYPYRFLRWENDQTFLVEVTGSVITSGSFKDYRQVWRVAADTAARTRIE
jgi:hypothetical protein